MKNQRLRVGYEHGTRRDARTIEVATADAEPPGWDLDAALDLVGKRLPRVDGRAKVTGAARFTHDRRFEGLLFAAVFSCPHAAATLKTVHTRAAQRTPGVVAVRAPHAGARYRYAGTIMGAVAASTIEAAREGCERLLASCRWEIHEHTVTVDDALKPGAPRVQGNRPNSRGGRPRRSGDPAGAFASSKHVVEGTYRTQVQTHSCLETHGALAIGDARGTVTIYASTQGTFATQRFARSRSGARDARVIAEHVGGGFGSKLRPGPELAYAIDLARETGRPVHLMLDRHQEHLSTGNRPDSIQRVKLGADALGRFTAIEVQTKGCGGVGGGGAGVANPMIYRFPALAKRETHVLTNTGPPAAYRAPGHPQGSFALEAAIDELAAKAGLDPLALRKKNLTEKIYHDQLDLGAERIGWMKNRKPDGSQSGPVVTGYGVACSRWGGTGGSGSEVSVRIRADGRVRVTNGAQDIGTGTRTVLAAVVAEELGLAPSALQDGTLTVALGDTASGLYGPGSGGSTTCASVAAAARQAAFAAKQALAPAVCKLFGRKQEDAGRIRHRLGRVTFIDGPIDKPFAEACKLLDKPIEVRGKRQRNYAGYRNGVAGVQFAQVSVDRETGIVRVLKIVAVQDCGRIVDRLTVESQIIGAVIQGVSYALLENRRMDRAFGRMLNANFESYKIAGALDVPEVEAIAWTGANGGNSVGCLGVGEPPTIPTAAAIGNAVRNALGVRVPSIPLTPGTVLAALLG